jgi:hypothetical protein
MIGTYRKSPSLYKRRYIDRDPDTQKKSSDAMKKGSILDDLLTRNGETDYLVNPHDGRTKAGKEFKELYGEDKIITNAVLSEVVKLYDEVVRQPFWTEGLKKRIFQIPLEGKLEGVLVCGLPDWIDPLPDGRYRLVDLKSTTVNNIATAKKWMWTAMDRGYYRQAAMYQILLAQKFGVEREAIDFCWCAVATDPYEPGLTKVALLKANQLHIDMALSELKEALQGIKANKFDEMSATWDDVVEVI